MEELGSTEEVAAAAAGRTTMLPCSCCWPVTRTEGRVEGKEAIRAGQLEGGGAQQVTEGARWLPCLAAPTAPHLFRAPSDRREAPGRSSRLARLAKMASPFVNNLTQNGRLSIRRAEPDGGIA